MANEQLNILYTIGHSNHTIGDFVSLLKRHEVTCVVDVRSRPYSHYCIQFNRESLAPALQSNSIEYVYLGDQLGARPNDAHCYDGDNINFEYLARTEPFILGLSRLINVASKHRVALMCAEKDPIECHRFILICKHLKGYNFHIRHILADGTTECHGDAERRLVKTLKVEPTIFEPIKTQADLLEQAYEQQAQKIAHSTELLSKTHHTVTP
jgi:uncharacterized protein (DUF488 family)